jgi:transposase
MTQPNAVVTGGVDTHKEFHVAAVINDVGRLLGTESFRTTASGYDELVQWMRGFGDLVMVGVEGTGCYGAGLTRHLAAQSIEVREVNRPNRQMRRRKGKSDAVDAEAAARAALNGEATGLPKTKDGAVESIRVLHLAYSSARSSRSKVACQIRDLIVSAPEEIHCLLGDLTTEQRVERCSRLRPAGDAADPVIGTKLALRSLAKRYQGFEAEMGELEELLDQLTTTVNPALKGAKGVGTDTAAILLVAAGENPERFKNEAAFAALCGVSPVQASSGKSQRHRLNRSGNRQANHALWRIVRVRMIWDPTTKAYVARRIAEGKSEREIVRCLKRYVAREVFRLLVEPKEVINGADLRQLRNQHGFTLTYVALALGTSTSKVSNIERSIYHDTAFTERYLEWLNEAGFSGVQKAA